MNKHWIWLAGAAAGALLLAGCGESGNEAKDTAQPATEATDAGAAPATETAGNAASGIDMQNIDPAVRAQDDFYRYVNGKWLDTVEIPGDYPAWGTFVELHDRSEKAQRKMIEAIANDASATGDAKKIADLFNSYTDMKRRNEVGATPLEGYLAEIDAISDVQSLLNTFAKFERIQTTSPLDTDIIPDFKESTRYAVYLSQSGLGLPNREYYFKDDERFKAIREAYPKYIAQILTLGGIADADAKAQKIYAIELRLAEHHWKPEENRDFSKIYNKFPISKLPGLMPDADLTPFLQAAGVAGVDYVIVAQPSYFTAMAKAVKEVPLDDWKAYLTFHLLHSSARFLSDEFVNAHFEFMGKLLSGQQELPPVWKRGVRFVNASMGEALGKLYVEKYFPRTARERMDELVTNLKNAFRTSVDGLAWMSQETKEKAKAKLAKFTTKIGHPDEWRDYSSLETGPDDLVANLVRASEFEYNRNLNKLGKPIDRNEWFMTPQTVNAYNNPTQNEIVFPAAILQPPFFNAAADDAVNYGAIGAVIGHEISHAFDDQGRKFDGDGNLTDWWTESDAKTFSGLTNVLVEQYNKYEPIKGLHVNGKLTLGENIADLSGLQIAYKAYRMSLGGKEAPVIDGLTGDQRFFMGWVQAWRSKEREEYLRQRLTGNPHSPPKYRANGIVIHMPEFHEAFGTKEGDGMYLPPDKRLKIW